MEVEFTGKFGEKSLDQLLCAAEHPWIEVKDGIAALFKLCSGKIDKRGLSGPPRAEHADHSAFTHIKFKNMIDKGLGYIIPA